MNNIYNIYVDICISVIDALSPVSSLFVRLMFLGIHVHGIGEGGVASMLPR